MATHFCFCLGYNPPLTEGTHAAGPDAIAPHADDRAVLVVAGLAQVYLAHLQANPSAQAHVKMVLVLPDGEAQYSDVGSTWKQLGAVQGGYGVGW